MLSFCCEFNGPFTYDLRPRYVWSKWKRKIESNLRNIISGQGRTGQPAKHTTHSLQLWFTRFALLVKLGQYDLCHFESEPFGSLTRPDIYFEVNKSVNSMEQSKKKLFFQFYPEMYPNRRGSMASFSFRLLLAELPSYLGQPKTAMDKLTELSLISSEVNS